MESRQSQPSASGNEVTLINSDPHDADKKDSSQDVIMNKAASSAISDIRQVETQKGFHQMQFSPESSQPLAQNALPISTKIALKNTQSKPVSVMNPNDAKTEKGTGLEEKHEGQERHLNEDSMTKLLASKKQMGVTQPQGLSQGKVQQYSGALANSSYGNA